MADLRFYQEKYGITTEDAAFERFLGALQTYYDANFYVNWNKVFANAKKYEREFALLSTLCDKPDREKAARELFEAYPQVIPALPYLIACRKSVTIVEDAETAKVSTYEFKALGKEHLAAEAERYSKFLVASGLIDLLERIRNVGDYATGIEVGMDTNARKNRGGDSGVRAFTPWIEQAKERMPKLEVKREADFSYLTKQGFSLPETFDGVTWDAAFWLPDQTERLAVMEINHYGGGGSKLGSIAREYAGRQKICTAAQVGFIWATDGLGWKGAKKALREAFREIPFIINVKLSSEGQLEMAIQSMLESSQQ